MRLQPTMMHAMLILQMALNELSDLIEKAVRENSLLVNETPVGNITAETPELQVQRNSVSTYEASLIENHRLQLRISDDQAHLFNDHEYPNAQDGINQDLEYAKWLIHAVKMRYHCMKSVASAIAICQHDFLAGVSNEIAPTTLRQIAGDVDLHVTTVSRAIDNKWIETERGEFPLRFFFEAKSS